MHILLVENDDRVRRLDEGTGRVVSAVLAGGAAEPVADDSGPPELRRLSASFDRMAETVTGALAAQRAFVADASHQLRNRLTALRLRLSNLQGHVEGAATDDHGAALEEAERLSALLDGLLALARTERSAPLADVDVDTAVSDRLDAWRPLAEHTGLRLERDGRLAIAARTVELAGGSLNLESPGGGGLRVVARLPAAGQVVAPAADR